MAREADHLRHGQPRPRDHARGGRARSARTPSSPPAAATIRTRSTTSWASPTSSAARSTCARSTINDADEDRRRLRDRGPRARGGAGRGHRRLSRPPAALRARLSDPDAVRSAPDQSPCPSAVARGRHGDRRRAPADRQSASATAHELRSPPRPDRQPDAADHRPRAAPSPSGSCSPRARRRRRIRAALAWRNAGPRHADPDRPRGADRADRCRAWASATWRASEIHNARLSEHNRAYAEFLYRRAAAQRPAVPRLPAPGQPGPQRVRRLHGRRRATRMP